MSKLLQLQPNGETGMACPRCGAASVSPGLYPNCQTCGAAVTTETQSKPLPKSALVPWETDAADRLPMRALLTTARNILLSPEASFAQLKRESDPGRAWLYALIIGSIAAIATFLWSLLPAPDTNMLGDIGSAASSGEDDMASSLFAAPLLISLQLLLAALYVQAVLWLARAKDRTFRMTFRIVSYASTALLLQLIPVAGSFASSVYGVYLLLCGTRAVYGISRIRMFLLLAAPMLVLGLLFGLLIAFVLASGLASQEILQQLLGLGS